MAACAEQTRGGVICMLLGTGGCAAGLMSCGNVHFAFGGRDSMLTCSDVGVSVSDPERGVHLYTLFRPTCHESWTGTGRERCNLCKEKDSFFFKAESGVASGRVNGTNHTSHVTTNKD
jgi:hypothetical protein